MTTKQEKQVKTPWDEALGKQYTIMSDAQSSTAAIIEAVKVSQLFERSIEAYREGFAAGIEAVRDDLDSYNLTAKHMPASRTPSSLTWQVQFEGANDFPFAVVAFDGAGNRVVDSNALHRKDAETRAAALNWTHKAVVTRDGKPYCEQHDPVAVAEKDAAEDAARRARWAVSDKKRAVELAAPDLLAACKAALALLDKQREEYDAAPTTLPHPPTEEGPIARQLRAAIARAEQVTP